MILPGQTSVIVEIVDIQRVAFGKAENHSPVSPHGDGPKAFELALERMEPKTGQVHIRDGSRCVESHENIAQFFGVFAHDPAVVVIFIKALEAFVADRRNQTLA